MTEHTHTASLSLERLSLSLPLTLLEEFKRRRRQLVGGREIQMTRSPYRCQDLSTVVVELGRSVALLKGVVWRKRWKEVRKVRTERGLTDSTTAPTYPHSGQWIFDFGCGDAGLNNLERGRQRAVPCHGVPCIWLSFSNVTTPCKEIFRP